MLTTTRPARVAVLCSRRAPGLLQLLGSVSCKRGLFDVVCVISSEPAFADADRIAVMGPAVMPHAIVDFYQERSSSLYRDMLTRQAYDSETVQLLRPFAPDIVLLDGYLFMLTRPMLEAFGGRILNLHFSDLTIRRSDGVPAYAGIRAVRAAIADGQSQTWATVHLVNAQPDAGAPVVRSWPFPVSPLVARARSWDATDMIKAYAYAHQEWMIREASGLLLSAALRLVINGQVDLTALGQRDPATVSPWLVDEHGRLTPPEALHICERLWAYREAHVPESTNLKSEVCHLHC